MLTAVCVSLEIMCSCFWPDMHIIEKKLVFMYDGMEWLNEDVENLRQDIVIPWIECKKVEKNINNFFVWWTIELSSAFKYSLHFSVNLLPSGFTASGSTKIQTLIIETIVSEDLVYAYSRWVLQLSEKKKDGYCNYHWLGHDGRVGIIFLQWTEKRKLLELSNSWNFILFEVRKLMF